MNTYVTKELFLLKICDEGTPNICEIILMKNPSYWIEQDDWSYSCCSLKKLCHFFVTFSLHTYSILYFLNQITHLLNLILYFYHYLNKGKTIPMLIPNHLIVFLYGTFLVTVLSSVLLFPILFYLCVYVIVSLWSFFYFIFFIYLVYIL